MTRILFLLLVAAFSNGLAVATTVAILEFGKGGTVRRTTTTSPTASVEAVASFWSATHEVDNGKQRRRRATQHPGMTVVPDVFNRADGGVVLGIIGSGVDLASMPTVNNLLEGSASIGHFHVAGNAGQSLMKKSFSGAAYKSDQLDAAITQKMQLASSRGVNKLESLTVSVDSSEAAAKVDTILSNALRKLSESVDKDSTVILHLVVDEESGAARRRVAQRNLSEDNENEQEGDEPENENQDEDEGPEEEQSQSQDEPEDEEEHESQDEGPEDEEGDADVQEEDAQAYEYAYNQGHGYGYGYINSYGEWESNYKTIFHIQYFNVITWTSIGLVIALSFSTYLMMFMPLMEDTLLFGESAKMMGD